MCVVYVPSTLLSILYVCHHQRLPTDECPKYQREYPTVFSLLWVEYVYRNKTVKHWTQQHFNINIKVIPFYTRYIWVLVRLMNKGVFLLNFRGREESIMQNKSARMQFDVQYDLRKSFSHRFKMALVKVWAFCSWCWEAWSTCLTVEIIKRKCVWQGWDVHLPEASRKKKIINKHTLTHKEILKMSKDTVTHTYNLVSEHWFNSSVWTL